MMFKRMSASLPALFVVCCFSVAAEPAQVMTNNDADAVISEYKSLRQQCFDAVDDDRKACFNLLNEANERYKMAKKRLGAKASPEEDNVHYVTFVN